jgi:hypothetical protein
MAELGVLRILLELEDDVNVNGAAYHAMNRLLWVLPVDDLEKYEREIMMAFEKWPQLGADEELKRKLGIVTDVTANLIDF